MNRLTTVLVLTSAIVAAVNIQALRIDPNLAADVLRQQNPGDVATSVRDNPQLNQECQRLALEQELARQAAQRGLAERTDVQNELQRLRRMTLMAALRDDLARSVPPPKETDVLFFYSNNLSRWTVPLSYLLDVFSVNTNDTALVAEAKIAATTLPLIKTNAADYVSKLRAKGISVIAFQQWFPTNNIDESVLTEIETTPKGDVRAITQPNGVTIVHVNDTRQPTRLTIEQARPTVENDLIRATVEKLWQDHLDRTRTQLGLDSLTTQSATNVPSARK